MPIVALTAHVLGDISKNFLASGFSGYLAKPINAQNLVATVKEIMQSEIHH